LACRFVGRAGNATKFSETGYVGGRRGGPGGGGEPLTARAEKAEVVRRAKYGIISLMEIDKMPPPITPGGGARREAGAVWADPTCLKLMDCFSSREKEGVPARVGRRTSPGHIQGR